jgi:cytochrome c biogenesis protein CcmG, thiol:disulfide interchange protein DsbE
MKILKFLIPLGIFLGLVAFLAAGLKLDPKEVPSPLIVWASWCVACQAEHPLLMAFSRKKLVPIYGLNYKDDRMDGMKWLARYGDPYDASLFDSDGRVGIDWGVYGVPETFVVDRQGVIRFKQIGPLTPEVIRDQIEPLVRKLNG